MTEPTTTTSETTQPAYIPALPTFSAPTDEALPKWATRATEWSWVDIDCFWTRDVIHDLSDDVRVFAFQESHPDGRVDVVDLGIQTDVDDLIDAGTARQVAQALVSAAEVIEGPRPLGERHSDPSTQRCVVQAIRGLLSERPIGQNQLALACGYGVTELSDLMSGARLMDFIDLERLARGLDMSAFELVELAVTLRDDADATHA
jgi:hypothetical protein